MKNVLKPLAKSVLMPLRLTAAVSAKEVAIHKKTFWIRYTSFRLRFTENNINNFE